jgi:hypothetical protein
MFENMGFDVEDYKYMKEAIGNAVERIEEFMGLEARLPPEGL